MQNRWLYVAIGGFIGGVLLRSFFDFGFAFSAFVSTLGLSLFIAGLVSGKRRTLLFLSLSVFSVGVGLLRFDLADLNRGSPVLDAKVGRTISAEGVVVDEPDVRENQTLLTVGVDLADGEAASAKVLVGAPRYPTFRYGDRVAVKGALQKPERFETETGRVFDYPGYLAKNGIFYQLNFADVSYLSAGHGSALKRALFSLKRAFLMRIERVIPEPHAALLGGLLIGAKQSLGKKLLDDFRLVGIIHIVVLSGYNITIVANALRWFFGLFFRKRVGIAVGALAIFLFVIMVGASATAVRAGAMALLVLLARATGRTSDVTRALILTGFVMLLQNPRILVFDPSFQLSFLATLGLIYFSPLIERRLGFVPEHLGLRETAIATIATQLFVLPFLLYQTGTFSVVSLPVNLLVLGAIPATMFFGFLTGAFGFIMPVLSLPFAFISYAFLAYELYVVEFFSALPFASISLSYFPAWLMVSLYLALGAFLFRNNMRRYFTRA